MADISKLSRLINGVHRELDLTSNTLVLQNLKVNLGTAFNATFAGTITANRTITIPDANVNLGDIANKANTNLGNLASTAVNADINPAADNAVDLGSESLRYAEAHAEVVRSGRMGDFRNSFTFSADTTNASAVIAVASTAGFRLYDDISGAGIPIDSYIVAINPNVSITINQNATATATGVTLTYKYNTMLLTEDKTGAAASGGVGLQSGTTDTGTSGPVWMFSGDSANGDSGHVYVGPGEAPNGTAGQVFLWGSVVNLNAFGGEISANSQRIQDVLDPTQLQDAATKNYVDTAVAGASEFSDSDFRIQDNGDATKQAAFEVSAISTATTRTITVPNANVNLADVNNSILTDGSRSMAANLNLNSNKITNLATATNAGDAVNLAQLQSYVAGLDFQADVNDVVADASTTSPGTGLPAAATGQRYILQSGTGSLHAGWSTIAGVGDNDIVQYNGSAWVVAYDVSVQGEGALVWDKDSNAFYRYDGTDWSEFGGLAGITAGAGLQKSGNVLSLELDTDPGLEYDTPGDAGKLRVKVDGSTIERHSSGIRVKADGITANEIADDAVTADHLNSNVADQDTLTGANGAALAVQKAPALRKTMVAGESFAANTSFLVRMARTGETAGRVYKADQDATSNDNFYAIGILMSTGAVSAGGSVVVTMLGTHILGSSDSAFAGADVGKPVFLTASGAFSITAPTTTNYAVVRAGIIENTDRIMIQPSVVGIN